MWNLLNSCYKANSLLLISPKLPPHEVVLVLGTEKSLRLQIHLSRLAKHIPSLYLCCSVKINVSTLHYRAHLFPIYATNVVARAWRYCVLATTMNCFISLATTKFKTPESMNTCSLWNDWPTKIHHLFQC